MNFLLYALKELLLKMLTTVSFWSKLATKITVDSATSRIKAWGDSVMLLLLLLLFKWIKYQQHHWYSCFSSITGIHMLLLLLCRLIQASLLLCLLRVSNDAAAVAASVWFRSAAAVQVNQASLFVRLLPDNSMEGVGHDAAAVAVAAVVAWVWFEDSLVRDETLAGALL